MRFDSQLSKAHSIDLEYEQKLSLGDKACIARLPLFRNDARMGNYRQAIEDGAAHPDIILTRSYGRSKNGFVLNLEISADSLTGLFSRASWNDGKNETWNFTEIDRSISVGLWTKRLLRGRPDDELSVAAIANGLSSDHAAYLSYGGCGFILGDGRLNYSPEMIGEALDVIRATSAFSFGLDYQFVLHPGYNRDRGFVHVLAIRFHVEL